MGEGEGEEAEYAWLQPESLKSFSAGTSSSNPDGFVSSDSNLQSCIAAANRALKVCRMSSFLHAFSHLLSAQGACPHVPIFVLHMSFNHCQSQFKKVDHQFC